LTISSNPFLRPFFYYFSKKLFCESSTNKFFFHSRSHSTFFSKRLGIFYLVSPVIVTAELHNVDFSVRYRIDQAMLRSYSPTPVSA